MSYNTWVKGYQEANLATDYAIRLEHGSTSSLPDLRDRIFPAYLKASKYWSSLLASGLSPPKAVSPVSTSFIQDEEKIRDRIGDKAEAMKQWKLCLERAKLIKGRISDLGDVIGRSGVDIAAPPSLTQLSKSEGITAMQRQNGAPAAEQIAILRESNLINCSKLPIWSDTKSPSWPESIASEIRQEGPYGRQPSLSLEQQHYSPAWIIGESPINNGLSTHDICSKIMVQQGLGANCSVVVGLDLCLKHNMKWKRRLIESQLTFFELPSREGNGMAPKHWYKIKLFVNGCWRAIVIDASLPTRTDRFSPCLHAKVVEEPIPSDEPDSVEGNQDPSRAQNQLQRSINCANAWVPLVEKAYMTLHSGYDFPGSFPSIDIYTLTSWIPEKVLFASSHFRRERTWRSILSAHEQGKCLLALGTGPRSTGKHGLVPLHAYGISHIWEGPHGRRNVTVENPWRTARQSGATDASRTDGSGWTRDLRDTLVEEEISCHTMNFSWDEICNSFETLEINWNPTMFAHQAEIHSRLQERTVAPRYELKVASQAPGVDVWLLLVRHFTSDENKLIEKPSIALDIAEEDGDGHTTWRQQVAHPVAHSNSPFVLVRHTCLRSNAIINVAPMIETSRAEELLYSIFGYSDARISLTRSATSLPFEIDTNGDITKSTAGGNLSWPTFLDNPQYRLRIAAPVGSRNSESCAARITVFGDSPSLPLGLTLVNGSEKRLQTLSQGDIILEPLKYRQGVFTCEVERLPVGDYIFIVSTFKPNETGSYRVVVETTLPATLDLLPLEGAGLHQRIMQGAWTSINAAGRPTIGYYPQNPTYEILVRERSSINARMHLIKSPLTSINLTLFRRISGGKLGDQIASSGQYSDDVPGVMIGPTKLEPGLYMLVASTYSPGFIADFRLKVYATRPIDVSLLSTPATPV